MPSSSRPDRVVERWSHRAATAQCRARTELADLSHERHIQSLRRMLLTRYLVVPLLKMENAFVLHEDRSAVGLAAAVHATANIGRMSAEADSPSEPVPTSAEIAARGSAHISTAPAIPVVPDADQRILLVYVAARRPQTFADITATLFKGLKLLDAFGCGRFWLYAPLGFEIDYERDLTTTREFDAEGPAFFERIAFLAPFDVALMVDAPREDGL